MPIYAFKCESCGQYTEEHRCMADSSKPKKCDCGQPMDRDIPSEMGQYRQTPGNWPMASDAAGVNPDQAQEAMAHAASIGIPTQFDNEGRAIFNNARHRKAYCEAIGLYDRNGGYSDPQRS